MPEDDSTPDPTTPDDDSTPDPTTPDDDSTHEPAEDAARDAAGLSNRAEDDPVDGEPVPEPVVDAAERLTHLAREAGDDDEADAYRADRDARLAEHDYTARVREDDAGATLVLHPEEWVADGTIRPDRIDDTDRAREVALAGTGDPDEWADVDAHNRDVVARVREEHGDVHARNVDVLADFAGNHYAKPIEELTAAELREFATDYTTRNAWLDDEQEAVLEQSVRYGFEAAKERVPDW